jgi:hypothetical protein
VALALLFGLQMLFFAAPSSAQESGCTYDKAAPSLDNARLNFKSLNYRCAELELLDLLNMSTTTLQEKADVYVLLAAVYYAMMGDDEQERRDKVVEQFTAAFREYRDWKGTLEITSSEFAELMEEAKQRVDSGEAGMETTIEPVSLSTCPSSTAAWVSTGVFVAAGAYFIISSSDASSKWDDYEADPAHPTGLYDDYESAISTRNIVGLVTGVAAVTTGYLWMKYKSAKKDCEQGMGAGLEIAPASRGLQLTYRF